MRQSIIAAVLIIAAASCSPKQDKKSEATSAPDAPAGAYTIDPYHASLLFRVNHLGFSHYTARFKRFGAQLQFDPSNPTASQLEAKIDARSIETDFSDPATLDFNSVLQNDQWLDTAKFPEITYRSAGLSMTGPASARIMGDLTLHGITHTVALDATFNGGYRGNAMDPHARIGFSARGTLKRSDFGMGFGLPAPGSTLGVGDEVEIIIEAEFSGPPQAAPTQPNQ